MHDIGLVSIHAPMNMLTYYKNGTSSINWNVTDGYDFVGDIMASLKFEELARKYPNAKFILTQRDKSQFARAAIRFFRDRAVIWQIADLLYDHRLFNLPAHRFFQEMYGKDYLTYSAEDWERLYDKFEERVRSYFAREGQRKRLLEIDVTKNEGWEKLGPFLGIANMPSGEKQGLQPAEVYFSIPMQSFWSLRNLVERLIWYAKMRN
jgi:hypothetical protein